jgi:hypothetical protein
VERPEKEVRVMAEAMMRDEFEATLIRRAWRDPAFRERLVKDPKKTIEAEFGRAVAADCEIVVVDESQGKVGIVIPVPPPAGAALSDQDLEKVAGGATPMPQGFEFSWRSQMTMPFSGMMMYPDWVTLQRPGGNKLL